MPDKMYRCAAAVERILLKYAKRCRSFTYIRYKYHQAQYTEQLGSL